MISLNTRASYAFRALVPLHWILIAAVWRFKMVGSGPAIAAGILIFYVPAALICLSIFTDWFTRKDPSRPYAKLIDGSLWGIWIISMGYIVLHSLQMGVL
jgi:hypothetical protein